MSPSPLHFPGPEDDRDPVVVPVARAPRPDGPRQTDTSLINRRTLERHWIVVSILVHLSIVGALVLGLLEPTPPKPLPVLQITLVPQGPGGEGASGGNGGAQAPGTEAAAPEATPEATSEPSQPEIPPPAPEPVSPPTPTPPIVPPPPPVKEVPPPPAPVREVPPPVKAKVPTPPTMVEVEVPPPKPRHAPPKRQVTRPRETTPRATPRPTATPTPGPAQTEIAAAPGGTPGPSGQAGPGKGSEGVGKGAIGNTAGPGDDYLERLYRHLLRYKKYPPEAISQKQQGSVTIGFTIARDGTVRDARVEKSSGSPMLDRAALEMLNRASPAPPLPDTFKGKEAHVKFPIDYKLSLIDQMF